jgi:hypothetical protein
MSGAAYLSRCWLTADLRNTRSEELCAPNLASPSRKRHFRSPSTHRAPPSSENLQNLELISSLDCNHPSIPTANVTPAAFQNP